MPGILDWIEQNLPHTPIARGRMAQREQAIMSQYRKFMMDQTIAEQQQQQQARGVAQGAWNDPGTWQPAPNVPVTPQVGAPGYAQTRSQLEQFNPAGTGRPSLMQMAPPEQRPLWEAYSKVDPVGALQKFGERQTLADQQLLPPDVEAQRIRIAQGSRAPTQPTDTRTGPQRDAEAIGLKPGTDEYNAYISERTLPQRPSDLYATRTQQAGSFVLPSGEMVPGEFTPNKGVGYRDKKTGELVPLPQGARPATPSMGGYLNPSQFLAKRNEFLQEQQALRRLNTYGQSVGNMETGLRNWASSVTAKFRTMLGSKELNPAEFARMTGEGQLQALLGLFRTDVVGPGVMTEFDAQRVLAALGGNVGMLQNPQTVERLLRDLYRDKMDRVKLLEMEIARNSPIFGVEPLQMSQPDVFGGTNAPAAPDTGIPQGAIQELMADPSAEAIREFDEVFGAGAAGRILGR